MPAPADRATNGHSAQHFDAADGAEDTEIDEIFK
ncbi:hypothetical protein QO011_004824 [Labrys wisconsinensis]|uniref:Uncharacterized protein n=1 Tax=Labrys wisconsinensis TaxID=425677 RepID=A0ABU0JF94_9HYPH|nr:hypothetical protein [Labrys wisconsinensis]